MTNELEELLGAYWDCAYQEGHLQRPDGNKANKILHDIREAFEPYRKDAERYRFLKTEVIAHHDTVFLAALAAPDSFIDTAIAAKGESE